MTTPNTPHFEAALQRDSDHIRAKVFEMAALGEQALHRAFEAFLRRDRQLAYSVILHDQDVDALETELDRLCLEFIVRHQPAAAHLRFVYSASKIVNELERIGDYAESIARQALTLSALEYDVPLDAFKEMASLSVPMVHNAARAFVDRNPDLARATMAFEPRVNLVRDALSAQLVTWREQGRLPLDALPPLINIARRLERVSDQATNICEEALYFATGEYLRHLPREGFRVLFVDATHGCLSRMAEEIGKRTGVQDYSFLSAGVCAEPVDPQSTRVLAEMGLDVSGQPSRTVGQVENLDQVQVIVSLGLGLDRVVPQRPAKKTVGLDWAVPDPAQSRGSADDVRRAYQQVWHTLEAHVRDLCQAVSGKETGHAHGASSSSF